VFVVATFNDLEIEVRKLRQKVRRLETGNAAAENAAVVNELVSTDDSDRLIAAGGGGGISGAFAAGRAEALRKMELKAIGELKSGAVQSQQAVTLQPGESIDILGAQQVSDAVKI
jgi:hypothetical protein